MQPFVGVATCWNESAPCNISLSRQAQETKKGVKKSFGTPRVFNTEKECLVSLANGRIQIEAQGWMVLDSHCYYWGQKV